jgi:hypothetical protein
MNIDLRHGWSACWTRILRVCANAVIDGFLLAGIVLFLQYQHRKPLQPEAS